MSAPSPSSTHKSSFVNDSSPPTSLAVTIFVVAFAVIFAIFGGFLIIGLVRRRRNPARYGPRPAVAGRAKQTKKKGLAMAVLESIPVVRFGGNSKSPGEGVQKDVELSGALGTEDPARTSSISRDVASDAGPEISQLAAPADEEPSTQDVEGTGTECSICLADFVESEEVRVLPCHHRFHPVCIDPWLLNVSGTCPICRYDLQPSRTVASAEEPDATTAVATPATPAQATPETTTATLEVPLSRTPRDRTSFRARLRDIRQSAHTGPEYISALRHLYHDHERRRPVSTVQVADTAPQEQRPT